MRVQTPPFRRATLSLMKRGLWGAAFTLFCACSAQNAKQHYLLAERLWSDRQYAAAAAEFEKVIALEPHGKLGTQALFRAANTQMLFLNRNADALSNFRRFAAASPDRAAVWEAQVQIGEILFSRLEQHEAAIEHYSRLLEQYPAAREKAEFSFRTAQANFFLRRFDRALKGYALVIRGFPQSPQAERASYEVGFTLLTRAAIPTQERSAQLESYQEAIDAFENFIRRYPKSDRAVLARFGVASALEETDQLSAALQTYISLRGKYPSPEVIETKIRRIQGRLALQRTRK